MVLIRRNAVEVYGWTTDEQFNRDWSLCQMTPGINLIALSILLGKQIAGWRGIVICLGGMLLPSALVTVVITAGFLVIRDLPVVSGALRGILPATVGLGLVTACQMAQSPLGRSLKRGVWQTLFAFFLLITSGMLLWTNKASVISVLLGAGVIGAFENFAFERVSGPQKEDGL